MKIFPRYFFFFVLVAKKIAGNEKGETNKIIKIVLTSMLMILETVYSPCIEAQATNEMQTNSSSDVKKREYRVQPITFYVRLEA